MKIGLLKFCIPLDFDVHGSTSNGGQDDRYGFIRELLRRGHTVTIFTPLVKGTKNNPKEERWLTEFKEEDLPEDLRFIKQLGYVPNELPVGEFKVDVLLCDAGVGNFMFRNNYHPEASNPDNLEATLIRRFAHVINAHKGPVFYMHCDPSLPFYFRQLAGRKYPWGHKKNGYTNNIPANRGEKWVRDSGWATEDEIFKDKTSIVLTRCLPSKFEMMIDNFDVDRAGYKEFSDRLHFEYVPPAYAYDLAKDYRFQEKIEYPLFYSGGDRRRRIAFRKFYEEMGVPTYVSGKWDEVAMESFDGINFLGWVENRRGLLDCLNKSGAVVQIQPKDAARMGWWTARTMEAAACRTMGFIDGGIVGAKDLVFDKWFVLNSKKEAQDKIYAFLSMSLKDRIGIIETQLAYCKTMFTWEKFTDVFMSLSNKYLKKNIKREVRQKYHDYTNISTDNFYYDDILEIRLQLPSVDFKSLEIEEIAESIITVNNLDGEGIKGFNQLMNDMIQGQEIENSSFQDIPKSIIENIQPTFKDIPIDVLKP